jgi:hypothetical protein
MRNWHKKVTIGEAEKENGLFPYKPGDTTVALCMDAPWYTDADGSSAEKLMRLRSAAGR